jgi:hypothetical protein
MFLIYEFKIQRVYQFRHPRMMNRIREERIFTQKKFP